MPVDRPNLPWGFDGRAELEKTKGFQHRRSKGRVRSWESNALRQGRREGVLPELENQQERRYSCGTRLSLRYYVTQLVCRLRCLEQATKSVFACCRTYHTTHPLTFVLLVGHRHSWHRVGQ